MEVFVVICSYSIHLTLTLCYSLGIYVFKSEVGHYYHRHFLPHFSLTMFSINKRKSGRRMENNNKTYKELATDLYHQSPTLCMFCCCSPFSSHSFLFNCFQFPLFGYLNNIFTNIFYNMPTFKLVPDIYHFYLKHFIRM